jgi:hypothetical protein
MCCVVLALVSILEHYLLLLRTLDVNYVWYQRDSSSPYVILFGTKKKPSKKIQHVIFIKYWLYRGPNQRSFSLPFAVFVVV